MSTGVPLMSLFGIELFFAFIARKQWSQIVQMHRGNVSLKISIVTKNSIAMFASVRQALMHALYMLFEIGRFC